MADPDNVMFKKAYHVEQGEVLMYAVDANMAVANFPNEWSFKPWDAADEAVAPKGKKGQKAAAGDNQ